MGQALGAIDTWFGVGNLVREAGFAINGAAGAVFLAGIAADAFFGINLHKKHFVAIRALGGHIKLVCDVFHFNARHCSLLAGNRLISLRRRRCASLLVQQLGKNFLHQAGMHATLDTAGTALAMAS